jgi:hypothetical protein
MQNLSSQIQKDYFQAPADLELRLQKIEEAQTALTKKIAEEAYMWGMNYAKKDSCPIFKQKHKLAWGTPLPNAENTAMNKDLYTLEPPFADINEIVTDFSDHTKYGGAVASAIRKGWLESIDLKNWPLLQKLADVEIKIDEIPFGVKQIALSESLYSPTQREYYNRMNQHCIYTVKFQGNTLNCVSDANGFLQEVPKDFADKFCRQLHNILQYSSIVKMAVCYKERGTRYYTETCRREHYLSYKTPIGSREWVHHTALVRGFITSNGIRKIQADTHGFIAL